MGGQKIKSINIFLGFFFIVNFCLGTGFLGVPYAFFYSGYLAAVPTLLLVTVISWINANYLLEVMARAQALEYFEKAQKPSGIDTSSGSEQDFESTSPMLSINRRQHPAFEITLRRKFEVVELCEIFFNRWVKYLYLIILSIYCFLASWSFSTVAGSALALNIPYNFSGVMRCENDPFHHHVLPVEATCRNAYYFSLFIFAVIVITLSLLDLKEQAIIQMILGLMRFLTVGAIIIYSIAKAAGGGDACEGASAEWNTSNDTWMELTTNATRYTDTVKGIVLKFDPKGWVDAIPIFTYAFILHQGIASLTHPVKQKRYMWYLTTAMFGSALFCYMSLGVIVPLWFKASIQETVTLNFGKLTYPGYSIGLRILAYYLILFPALDVSSAYPLMVHTVVNNLYIIIVGHDTSRPPSKRFRRYDFFLRLILRFTMAILPILAAFGVANLIYVLKYAGLMGFNICFFFPTLLQLRSIYVCKKKFAISHISVSRSHDKKGSLSVEKQSLLSVQEVRGKEKKSRYMTPFSSRFISYPFGAIIVGLLGVCLFILTLVSLGISPDRLTCAIDP